MLETVIYQPELIPYLPTVKNNKDYDAYYKLLCRIDHILNVSNLDLAFAENYISQVKSHNLSANTDFKHKEKELQKYASYALTALRCNIIGKLTQESFRKLSTHIAESSLLQMFCKVLRMGEIHSPSKSRLQRYSETFDAEFIREQVVNLIHFVSSEDNPLNLKAAINTDDVFLDGTCLKANIHYPVDWLLLRDGMLTILKAILVIRRHGLKHRITSPERLMKEVNKLSIEMTHTRRKRNSNRARKQIFRRMKKLAVIIIEHGKRYRRDLSDKWKDKTDFSLKQVQQLLKRLDQVLEKLPYAIKQAHKRIITGLKIPSREKMLSLYDDSVRVIVRGKADAEVEFGNVLFLAEQMDGIILDWKLYDAGAFSDTTLTAESLIRMEKAEFDIKSVTGDRGCDSKSNRKILENNDIFNGLCPRNLQEFIERLEDEKFSLLQNRRSQTEGRIAIFKNNIIGSPIKNKFFEYKDVNISLGILAHNLWVIARLPEL